MASLDVGPPSLLNQFVLNCWVVGTQKRTSQRGEDEQFTEVRTELSDHTIYYLHRTDADLGRLIKRLVDSFPEEKEALSKSLLDGRSGILALSSSLLYPSIYLYIYRPNSRLYLCHMFTNFVIIIISLFGISCWEHLGKVLRWEHIAYYTTCLFHKGFCGSKRQKRSMILKAV